jgi:hypothetical protein
MRACMVPVSVTTPGQSRRGACKHGKIRPLCQLAAYTSTTSARHHDRPHACVHRFCDHNSTACTSCTCILLHINLIRAQAKGPSTYTLFYVTLAYDCPTDRRSCRPVRYTCTSGCLTRNIQALLHSICMLASTESCSWVPRASLGCLHA